MRVMEELEVTQPQRTPEALDEAGQVPAEGVSLRPPGGREGGVCCQLSAVLWSQRPPSVLVVTSFPVLFSNSLVSVWAERIDSA